MTEAWTVTEFGAGPTSARLVLARGDARKNPKKGPIVWNETRGFEWEGAALAAALGSTPWNPTDDKALAAARAVLERAAIAQADLS